MPIHLNEPSGGNFLDVHVSGILSQADYTQFVPEFERLAGQQRKLRVLFDMTGFHGWEAAAIWEEIKFDSVVSKYSDLAALAAFFSGFDNGNGRWRIEGGVAILWR